MIASNTIDMGSNQLNLLWNELIHSDQHSRGIQTSLPVKQSFEINSSGKYFVTLTDSEIKTKLEKYQDLIFAWSPLMDDLQSKINSDVYITLFDPEGFCLADQSGLIGIQCCAAPYLHGVLQDGSPISVKIHHQEIQSGVSDNRLPSLTVMSTRHCSMIFPICVNNSIEGYIGVGNFQGDIPDGYGLLGYVAARILESKYNSISALKQYARLLINGLPMYAFLTNENGQIISGNHRFRNLLNISEDDISSGFINISSTSVDFDQFLQNDPRAEKENFQIRTAYNEIVHCSLISKHQINMPDYPPNYLVLFQAEEKPLYFYNDNYPGNRDAVESPFSRMVGNTPKINHIKSLAEKVARVQTNVLIEGASGTGKELLAEAIHASSGRSGLFIPINCGAIPRELLLSELFGYEEGAFTGAKRGGKKGVFEVADGGTVLLDEIGEMPADMQVTLLRFLENRVVTRIGGTEPKKVDVRIIAATNRDLAQEVAGGAFREDLYYRLNVFTMRMPSLLERQADIPVIAGHLIEKLSVQLGIKQPSISKTCMDMLLNYEWPGNVRELRNVIEYALILSQGEEISEACLPSYLNKVLLIDPIHGSLEINERLLITEALTEFGGDVKKSANYLGIARQTLYRKMSKMSINRNDYVISKK